jgi:hypothetical protein
VDDGPAAQLPDETQIYGAGLKNKRTPRSGFYQNDDYGDYLKVKDDSAARRHR